MSHEIQIWNEIGTYSLLFHRVMAMTNVNIWFPCHNICCCFFCFCFFPHPFKQNSFCGLLMSKHRFRMKMTYMRHF